MTSGWVSCAQRGNEPESQSHLGPGTSSPRVASHCHFPALATPHSPSRAMIPDESEFHRPPWRPLTLLTQFASPPFRSSCLCCHFVSLFIFSSDFGGFYSVGHWQCLNGIGLGSEKIIVRAWPQAPEGQSASVSHLALPLRARGQPGPGGPLHGPASTAPASARERSDHRFHRVLLSNAETETRRNEGSSPQITH